MTSIQNRTEENPLLLIPQEGKGKGGKEREKEEVNGREEKERWTKHRQF